MSKKFFKVLPGIYLPLMVLVLWIFRKFYPEIDVDLSAEPIQVVTLRILAGFSFNSTAHEYWALIILTLAIYCILSVVYIIYSPELSLSFSRKIVIQEATVQFFYWVFCMKYSPVSFSQIKRDIVIFNVVLLTGFLLFGAISYMFAKIVINRSGSDVQQVSGHVAKFRCSNCGKEYDANVSYCLACKNEIHHPPSGN